MMQTSTVKIQTIDTCPYHTEFSLGSLVLLHCLFLQCLASCPVRSTHIDSHIIPVASLIRSALSPPKLCEGK